MDQKKTVLFELSDNLSYTTSSCAVYCIYSSTSCAAGLSVHFTVKDADLENIWFGVYAIWDDTKSGLASYWYRKYMIRMVCNLGHNLKPSSHHAASENL